MAFDVNSVQSLFVQGPAVIFKWMTVVGLGMYTFFAVVVLQQVKVMTGAVEAGGNGAVKLFAWMHFAMAVFLTIIAVIVL